ncbi:unnamed protein product [Calypogeia fissa]
MVTRASLTNRPGRLLQHARSVFIRVAGLGGRIRAGKIVSQARAMTLTGLQKVASLLYHYHWRSDLPDCRVFLPSFRNPDSSNFSRYVTPPAPPGIGSRCDRLLGSFESGNTKGFLKRRPFSPCRKDVATGKVPRQITPEGNASAVHLRHRRPSSDRISLHRQMLRDAICGYQYGAGTIEVWPFLDPRKRIGQTAPIDGQTGRRHRSAAGSGNGDGQGWAGPGSKSGSMGHGAPP